MEGGTLFSFFFSFFFVSLVTIPAPSVAVDTIAANQSIRDGETIVSAGEFFEMGFFSPGNSQNRYLGIWYKKLANGTVYWVANRDRPLVNDTSGVLRVAGDGTLQLVNGTNQVIWSSSSPSPARNPVARLLDTGNLVVRDEASNNPQNTIWQSFDHPGDTFMPGMKFGKNLVTGTVTNFTAWTSLDDPSESQYVVYMDFSGYPQVYQRNAAGIQYRLGSWDGVRFTGMASLKANLIYTFGFVFNETDIYYSFELMNASVLSRMYLSPEGNMNRENWIDSNGKWIVYSSPTTDSCVRYALCGAYGSCNIDNSPACGCLRGFEPRRPNEWIMADWYAGCQRIIPLNCSPTEGFRMYSDLKLPDTNRSLYNESMTLDECEAWCKSNCNCTAYSSLNISGSGSGCLWWFGDLVDMRALPENGQVIYIRMAAAELAKDRMSTGKKLARIIVPIMLSVILVLGLWLWLIRRKRKLQRRKGELGKETGQDYYNEDQKDDLDLPLFSFSTLLAATKNFSNDNKLGEGGFGPVYKGELEEGRFIAVKRLSDSSTQGIEEFKNEVITVSKLQHRNLVKLLGCCIQGQETMLVYEYMPNKSLDAFIFDETQRKLLDWPKRFHIINGVARGLLYLHQDSRLRIVHRDLKAGNILLDYEMNAKISDFGMARSFGGNETETNTRRVVGTYGYMSPEYAGDGIFSVKSDIFSFGVLVLEIVSGKKNRGFVHEDHHHNLLGHAWRLHREGKELEIVDPSLRESWNELEIMRSIHISLLCVQHNPEDRPNMATVVLMLSSEGRLPKPKQPGFYTESDKFGPDSSLGMGLLDASNEVTVTLLDLR